MDLWTKLKPWRWAALPLAGLLLYWAGNCAGKAAQRDLLVVQQAEAALAQGKSYRVLLQQYQRAAQLAHDSALDYERRFRQRGQLVAQLDTALSRAATARDTIPILGQQNLQLRGQVSDLQQANVSLQKAFAGAQAQVALASQRSDSLEKSLRSVLTVAECRWNLVLVHPRCPSRTTALLVGVGTGALAVLATHH